MDTAKPRRRWFRFSLRTLFVVVTLLCLWLGSQVKAVRERQAVRREFEAAGVKFFETGWVSMGSLRSPRPYGQYQDPPFSRRLLGDRGVRGIFFDRVATPADVEALSCFPEAAIICWPDEDHPSKVREASPAF